MSETLHSEKKKQGLKGKPTIMIRIVRITCKKKTVNKLEISKSRLHVINDKRSETKANASLYHYDTIDHN